MAQDNNWEDATCPICKASHPGDDKRALYTFSADTIEVLKGGCGSEPPAYLNIVQCDQCGLAYLTPRPKEEFMCKVYEAPEYFEGGGQGGYDDYLGQKDTLELTFRWFLKKLRQKGLTGGALLDVGCGPGLFLQEARSYFALTVGTDLCKEMAGQASRHCDWAIPGGPRSAEAHGPFDLVTAIGVLEHIYDPVKFIEDCASLLKPSGHLVLVTPDITGFWRKLMGRKWPSFKLPEHIAYYSPPSMKELAHRTSMNVREVFPYHQAFPLNLVLKRLGITVHSARLTKRVSVPLPWVMMTAVMNKR